MKNMHCENCGNKIDKENNFCLTCGSQIDNNNITLIPYIEEQEIIDKEKNFFFLHELWYIFIALVVILSILIFPITILIWIAIPNISIMLPFTIIFSIVMLVFLKKKTNISLYLNFVYIMCNIIISLICFIIPATEMYNEIKLLGESDDSANMFSLARTYSNVYFLLEIGITVLVISIIFFVYYYINGKKIFKSN